ncbi:MAG: hypothetical protein ABIJ56_00720 [Pseudomonadota bacterium]
MMKTGLFMTIAMVASLSAGCRGRATEIGLKDGAEAADACAGALCSAPDNPVAPAGSTTGVSRIVFIGMDQACACTRKRIEASWKALQDALAGHPGIQVTRIQWDTNEDEAEKYADMKPLMAIPGIYFLDGEGKLVDQLQGDVNVDQVAAILR